MDARLAGAVLTLPILLAGCASSLSVTRPVTVPVRAVSLELDEPSLPTADRDGLIRALGDALARNGVTVVGRDERGAPALVGDLKTYKPGLEQHRTESGFLKLGHGELRAEWRLVDAGGTIVAECETEGSTSIWAATEWGDVLQSVGDDLASFLSGSD